MVTSDISFQWKVNIGKSIHSFTQPIINSQLHVEGQLDDRSAGLKLDLYQFCDYKNTCDYRQYIYKCMLTWIHLNIIESPIICKIVY